MFYNSGNVVSRPLESITSEVLIRILSEVIPDAKVLMNKRRQKLSGRVMTLEKLSKEMRKVPTAGVSFKTTYSRAVQSNSAQSPTVCER